MGDTQARGSQGAHNLDWRAEGRHPPKWHAAPREQPQPGCHVPKSWPAGLTRWEHSCSPEARADPDTELPREALKIKLPVGLHKPAHPEKGGGKGPEGESTEGEAAAGQTALIHGRTGPSHSWAYSGGTHRKCAALQAQERRSPPSRLGRKQLETPLQWAVATRWPIPGQ